MYSQKALKHIVKTGATVDQAVAHVQATEGINRCWIYTRVLRAYESQLLASPLEWVKPVTLGLQQEAEAKPDIDPIDTVAAIWEQRQTKEKARVKSKQKQRDRVNAATEDKMFDQNRTV